VRRNEERPAGVSDVRKATGVVVIGTEICGLSSCSGDASPTAPGRSDDTAAERAARRHYRPAQQIAEEIERATEVRSDKEPAEDETGVV
jgi:hypothetical protein